MWSVGAPEGEEGGRGEESFLCRICFVKIQIGWSHAQFVGDITKNIYLTYNISYMFSDFL